MNILFELGHPADVHFFRNAITELKANGHNVRVAVVSKEILLNLLDSYAIDYDLIGSNTPTLLGKALTLGLKDLRLIRIAGEIKPDMIVSFGSPYAAHASAVLSVPHIAFTDTEIAARTMEIMLPFTNAICTPSCYGPDLGSKQFRFNGYKELAYLHPRRFQPNLEVLERVGADPNEKLVVVRFGTISSSHDLRNRGLNLRTPSEQLSFVRSLEKDARVIVTSEAAVGPEVAQRMVNLPPVEFHSLLYYASLYVGDGATTASEAGVLGTPWIYVTDRLQGVQSEQQNRYGLGYAECSAETALERAIQLLQRPGLKGEWRAKREKMLSEKIDVTEFIVKFLETWPHLQAGAQESDPETPASRIR